MTAVPGLRPKFPLMMVLPVLVTAEAPRTPKLSVVPSGGAVATASAESVRVKKRSAANPTLARRLRYLTFILNLAFSSQNTLKGVAYTFLRWGKPVTRTARLERFVEVLDCAHARYAVRATGSRP